MTTTAQQLIEAGYSRSMANDPGKLATDGELLGVANRLYLALFALAAAAAPERYVSRVTMTLAGSPASGALTTDVIDVRRVQKAVGGTKVNVIPLEELERSWHLAPAVFREGGVLISRGLTGDPVTGDALTVWQLDSPSPLTVLASTLDVRYPERHVELIILELAMYLATKDSGRSPTEFAALKMTRDAHMETFLRLSGLSMTALTSPHGGVIVQRLQSLMAGAAPQAQ